MDNEENVRYVSIGESSNVWATMSNGVRDYDEEKIRDWKDYIDTLLVFAGLYSAIQTAFLAQLYLSLQEDPNTIMIRLLTQIAHQTSSYTLNAGFLNSTFDPSSISNPAFTPLASDVIVNSLWFASLLISLVASSLCILVKQWLQQYLASEYTLPQLRLRQRQFRHPGMVQWKVFEIASFLPVLLQIALGLFFAGMCIFTWTIHPSIAVVSTTIVCGWGYIFLLVTVAPLISSRCPYKTPLLDHAIRSLRIILRKVFVMPPTPQMGTLHKKHVYEEEDAVLAHDAGLNTLIDVDSILLDDYLLGAAVSQWDYILRANATLPPEDVMRFVISVFKNRQKQMEGETLKGLVDDRLLIKRTWLIIVDLVAKTLISGLQNGTELPSWTGDALIVLLSMDPASISLPSSMKNLLNALGRLFSLADDKFLIHFFATRLYGRLDNCQVTCLLQGPLLDVSKDSKLPISKVVATLVGLLCGPSAIPPTDHPVNFAQLGQTMAQLLYDVDPSSLSEVNDAFAVIIQHCMTESGAELEVFSMPVEDGLYQIFKALLLRRPWLIVKLWQPASVTTVGSHGVLDLIGYIFIREDVQTRRNILKYFTALACGYIRDVFPAKGAGDARFAKTFKLPIPDVPQYSDPVETCCLCSGSSVHPVNLCYIATHVLETSKAFFSEADRLALRAEWIELWELLAVAVESYRLTQGPSKDDKQSNAADVIHCLIRLDRAGDTSNMDEDAYPRWSKTFSLQDSLVPDDIFESLGALVPGMEIKNCRRLQRVRSVAYQVEATKFPLAVGALSMIGPIRIRLKGTVALSNALLALLGPPVAYEDNHPVYIGSAVLHDRVTPCAVTPSRHPPCRHGWLGRAYDHDGIYEVLRFDPSLMEWMSPHSATERTAILGGYEPAGGFGGYPLNHALLCSLRDGKLPGKTGAHLTDVVGACFPRWDHEIVKPVDTAEWTVLCWKTAAQHGAKIEESSPDVGSVARPSKQRV